MWCILWSRKPIEDEAMVAKSLKEVMVERGNLDLCHMFVVYNKLLTFITQTI
jgi:hypothetical protein